MEPDTGPIRLYAQLAPRLNLAAVQNAVPALRELVIENRGAQPLHDLQLQLTASPAFLAPQTLSITTIAAGGRFALAELDPALDATRFGRLTEAEPAELALALSDATGSVLAELRLATELLPRTYWAGLVHWPELVAAHVLPNDPAVARILKSASATLEANGRSGALDGYAGGAARAFELTSAIWTAVAGLGLSYALPPASFEQTGQKVRSPDQLAAEGLATCLDTALLFAAALEQAGLHALVVFTRGHAFTGLWLAPEAFAGPVVDDVSALRKRLQLDQLRVFETTLVTGRQAAGFRAACEHAAAQLAVDADFLLAVDIARARQQRIRPLATETALPTDAADAGPGTAPAFEPAPALDPLAADAELPPETAGDRLQRWQRRLLDLSLRNALLNFRPGKKALLLEARIAALAEPGSASGGLWRRLDTSADTLSGVLAAAPALRRAAVQLLSQPGDREVLGRALLALLAGGLPAPIATAAADFRAALATVEAALPPLFAAGELATEVAADWQAQPVAELTDRLRGLRARSSRLRPWCGWLAARAEAEGAGLGALVGAVSTGQLSADQLVPAFRVNHARQWLTAQVAVEPLLKDFLPMTHEHGIAEFRRIDARFQQLTREWLRARLMARIPAEAATRGDAGWATLNREFAKKRMHLPLRELVNRAGPALLQLTPCLLMSPLSVAQYLAPGTPAFDLVIFDEASQIPVWDAIGAIARGRQVVMVGDPKQLPPTSFFDRASHEPEDLDIEEELESILDECLGARLPQRELSWHYRSRHESLIAFSNHRYYGGGLITFPSPVTDDRAVSFHAVAGVYAKGGARTNLIEARALVADLVATLRAQADSDSPVSIGVVSFNAEQQGLIEDLLDQERRQDPALERWFDEGQPEPVFVKNLESVQGDERDLIYFSITYGPDAQGRVAMQFGPLNREGGHRRLNVAITRARVAMKVYSSLKPEQMDISRTQAKGVADLKHFLDYAMRGAVALPGAGCGRIGEHESPFEEAVAAALEARGWQLHPQVGVSSFRIDLGVVHPDAPGRYLCGLECDGATYHRSATARDRDLLREQVLKGLGWTLVRIWSTDWWQDREGALARTVARLDALLAEDRARRPAVLPGVLPGD